ncbi:MAG: UpxY family transcription antiterminator [Flavobacterium sp.]|jgi:transcription antitermination factor NusG|nr:UpxY family transcription antiterminator [Flavobacterium sp.]
MSWFAIYTRPKNEKKVVEGLEKLGIEVYCPMITQVKQWSDRKKKVEMPLINSYVFVNIEDKKRNIVFEVPGVVRYLFWLGKPAIIQEQEIDTLKASLKGIFSSVEVNGIQPGDSLTISQGPFQGKEGVVAHVDKNKIRLVLKELGVLITISKEIE